MFDKLFDAIAGFAEFFMPFIVLDQTERGVVLRLGKFHREIGTGFHWLIPMVEEVRSDIVIKRTFNIRAQSLVTSDDQQIVISTIVTARIRNIKMALLEVEDFDDVIVDTCYGATSDAVKQSSWDQIKAIEFQRTLEKTCKELCRNTGVEILRVQTRDLSTSSTLRLLNEE